MNGLEHQGVQAKVIDRKRLSVERKTLLSG